MDLFYYQKRWQGHKNSGFKYRKMPQKWTQCSLSHIQADRHINRHVWGKPDMSHCQLQLLILSALFFSEGLIVRKCCLTVGWCHGLTSECGVVESKDMLLWPIHSDLFFLQFQVRKSRSENNALSLLDHSRVPKSFSCSPLTLIPSLHNQTLNTAFRHTKHTPSGFKIVGLIQTPK